MFQLRVGRLYGDTCTYVCPWTWLNWTRTHICLSPTMLWAFYLKILLWLILYFWKTGGQLCLWLGAFSELLAFARYLLAFFSWARVTHIWSQRPNIFVVFRRPNVGREHSLTFVIEYDRHILQRWLSQYLGIGLFQIILSKSGLILKTVATFVQKGGLIWQQRWHFTSFDHSVHKCDCWLKIVNHWDKRDNSVMCAEKKKFGLKLLLVETEVAKHKCKLP